MKKFRILGIIAIIAILANFIGGLDEDWKDFKKGFEEGQSGATEMYESGHHMITRVKLNVKPLSGTTVDSLNNNRVDSPLPYTVTEIETYAKPSAWYILAIGLAIPGLFFFLIGFYSLIRLLISISRRKVFTPANVLRLRWFAYTSASLKILTAIGEWLTGSAAMNQISIPGYKIISYVGYSPDLGGNNPSYPLCRDICYRSKNERGTRPNHLKKKSYERKEYSTLKREKHFLFDAFLDNHSVCKFIHLFPCVASIVGQQSSEDINQHWMDLLLSVCL